MKKSRFTEEQMVSLRLTDYWPSYSGVCQKLGALTYSGYLPPSTWNTKPLRLLGARSNQATLVQKVSWHPIFAVVHRPVRLL